ncbi:MAG: formylglycine-generating enzyme family protein [Deltaproteobacteria bacterium]|nr:formylglycine-generating enzyme family protein [Deltaproteobacteria bacterium]
MGSPRKEPGRLGGEIMHKVNISKGFYIQTTEVTQGQWASVMGNNPSKFKKCGADCPIERVSWKEVQQFIRKLNEKEKQNLYRLPTEAEWEYACRAGSTTAFFNGDISETVCRRDPNLDIVGWYCGNSGNKTHPVALILQALQMVSVGCIEVVAGDEVLWAAALHNDSKTDRRGNTTFSDSGWSGCHDTIYVFTVRFRRHSTRWRRHTFSIPKVRKLQATSRMRLN